jgi:hypothetical protein
MNNFNIIPAYSLYDLKEDILRGEKKQFDYNMVPFTVKLEQSKILVISPDGYIATIQRLSINSMLDLQGAAGCLLHYCKNIWINGKGDVLFINPNK